MSIGGLFRNNTIKSLIIQFRFASCWSCNKDNKKLLNNLFCSHCNVLQMPNKESNYFSLLGIEENYDIDETTLAKKFKELQMNLHPDKFANRKKEEQEISAQYSSLVNEAYKTLLEPLARGIYMLKLRGKEIPEKTEIDNEFLMKIMEKNEEVENAETEKQIMHLRSENKKVIEDLQKQVATAFFAGDMKRAIKVLSIMKYYTSIDKQIQDVIREKGIIR